MSGPAAPRTDDRPARIDALPKVTGGLRYTGDVHLPGLLHARIVPSPHAHARIVAIDGSAATALPGVVAVLSAADMPVSAEDNTRMFSPLAREEAIFAGQPVALVVAETEAIAEDGVDLVEVEYELLPAAVDVDDAMRPGGPVARLNRFEDGASVENMHSAINAPEPAEITDEELSENVVKRELFERGDVERAFAAGGAVVEGHSDSAWIHQVPMETPVSTARIEADGTLWVETSTQALFLTQQGLAWVYGLPIGKVRVVGAPVGGSFGSKFLLLEPVVAGAALALRAPVRLAMTRSEELRAGVPAGSSRISAKVAADQSGRLRALEGRVVFDDGAYAELSCELLAVFALGGPYAWDAFRIKSLGVETNRFGTGAYRAPGAPQAIFAIEAAIDDLAEELGRDPVEMRLASLAEPGDLRVDGGSWPRHGYRECLEEAREHPLWKARYDLPEGEGVGLATGIWPGANGSASVTCRLDSDGGMTVLTGVSDLSGVESTFQVLAAAALDLPLEMVRIIKGDTHTVPYAPPTGGSTATYVIGAAVRKGAMEIREKVLEIASERLEIGVADLEIVDGVAQARGAPFKRIMLAEIGEEAWSGGGSPGPVESLCTNYVGELAPITAASLAHVRVDPDTCAVEVLKLVTVQDVGHALNPALIEEQMHGGTLQGIGRALYEELLHDEEGRLLTDSLMDYAVPVAAHAPAEIELRMVEVPSEQGPLGARGVGEGSVLAVPAAIGNAIKAATGLRMTQLPMTPQRIWQERRRSAGRP